MEKNRLEDVFGAVAKQAMYEGRFGILVDNTTGKDFGSEEDLPGIRLPASEEEAKRAKYIVAWPVSNIPTPYFAFPHPDRTFSRRAGGWDQAQDTPWATTVYLTHPGNSTVATEIPSGNQVLAIAEGTVTIPSGHFVDSAEIRTKGTMLVVEYNGADAGKPKASSTMTDGVVAVVERYNSDDDSITVKLY